MAAEIGDGWLPLYYSPYYDAELYRPCLEEGFARRGGQPDEFVIAPSVPFIVHDDVEQAADLLRPMQRFRELGGAPAADRLDSVGLGARFLPFGE